MSPAYAFLAISDGSWSKQTQAGVITSVLMSSIRLVKEFRYQIFKEIKLKRSGKAYYYTEVCFEDIDKESRLDGLILIVVSGVIQDAVFIAHISLY